MNVVVAQSGGPTGAINASLLGVYRQARSWEKVDTVFGSLNGIEGIIHDRLVNLNERLQTEEDFALLRQTPSSALRSCRYKLPDFKEDATVYRTILTTLEKHGIGAFFYIGGNDSMDTVKKLADYFSQVGSPIQVIGVPKTIDNDLMVTDHTPGYGSAAKFIATSMLEMIRDCTVYDLKSVLIVEIMGRDTGWLTVASALPRLAGQTAPHLVYLPESAFKVADFIRDIAALLQTQNTVIVAVSEGVEPDTNDQYQSGKVDTFGHKYLSGIGKFLETAVREQIGCKVRSVELNILQRCASHVASLTDIEEAEQVGAHAVTIAMEGKTGKVAVIHRESTVPYTVSYDDVSVDEIANKVKYVPKEWINEQGNNITENALNHVAPLIKGELPIITENGLPRHWVI